MNSLKPTAALLEELKTSNQNAIATNERIQQEIDDARQQTERAQRELETLRASFNQQFTQQQQILRRLAPEVLAEKLQHAAGEAEQHSDALAEGFLDDNSIDLKDFTTQFLAARKQYHLRLIKREALLASRHAATQPGVILASNPHSF
jgi:chromosome segregation ATPase